MTVFGAEQLETESYSKRLSLKIGTFWVIEVLPKTLTDDEDSIGNTVFVSRAAAAQWRRSRLLRTTGLKATRQTLSEERCTQGTPNWKRSMSLMLGENPP